MVLGLRLQSARDAIVAALGKRPGHLFEYGFHVTDIAKFTAVFNSWAVRPVNATKGQSIPIGTRSVLSTGGARLIESTGCVLQSGERQIGTGCRNRNIMAEKGQLGDYFLATPAPPGPAERFVFVIEAR